MPPNCLISFSRSSVLLYLPISLIAPLLVVNMGMSLSMDKSELKRCFGARRCTLWRSSRKRKSFHSIRSLVQQKSFKKITSAFSAPTQPHLSLAGLEKVWKVSSSGLSNNLYPQFSGPVLIMFQYFPPPLSNLRALMNNFIHAWYKIQRKYERANKITRKKLFWGNVCFSERWT